MEYLSDWGVDWGGYLANAVSEGVSVLSFLSHSEMGDGKRDADAMIQVFFEDKKLR